MDRGDLLPWSLGLWGLIRLMGLILWFKIIHRLVEHFHGGGGDES